MDRIPNDQLDRSLNSLTSNRNQFFLSNTIDFYCLYSREHIGYRFFYSKNLLTHYYVEFSACSDKANKANLLISAFFLQAAK